MSSWLSNLVPGGNSNQNRSFAPPPPPNNNDNNNDNKSTKNVPSVGTWSNFDPTGLERAAQAAKELEKSRHAKDALDLSRIQEVTKQNEYQAQIKQQETYMEQLKIERARAEQEEKRRTLEAETYQHKQRSDYQDKLSRKRHEDQLALQQRMNEQNLKRQEESIKKQEAMKKATIEYEANLKKENDLLVMREKIRQQGKMRRENHDIELESMRSRLAEIRTTTLETLKAAGDMIGSGFTTLLNNPQQIATLGGSILLLSLGLRSIKAGVNVCSNYVESRLGKPTLIRETSRFNRKEMARYIYNKIMKNDDPSKVMRGIYLSRPIEEQLISASIATINTKRNNGYYRNFMFYGPPGTGKTLFAKSMAHSVGMDYAIMTGGDVTPLGREAVTEIHKVFNWAATSKKGLLLFIDEADAFLKRRNKDVISEDLRNALNAFLYHTGESSKNFMLILATNQPQQLDSAVNDRLDEVVNFCLPDYNERLNMLEHYFEKMISSQRNILLEESLQDKENLKKLIEKIAEMTENLSGRELSKLVISWQAAGFADINGKLLEKKMLEKTRSLCEQHNVKMGWDQTVEKVLKESLLFSDQSPDQLQLKQAKID